MQVRIVGVSVLRLLIVGALGFAVAGCEEWFEPPDTEPSFGGQTVIDQSYTVGEQIATVQLPAASGGDGRLSYALRPQVPGVTFDASARLLSGTPTDSGTYRMTYTVEDADADSDALKFTITVEPPDTAPSFGEQTVTDQSYTVGEQIATVQLPAASGGDGRLSYALRPQVPGVTFDASARLLSGTPTDSGNYRMTYTVEDEDADSDTLRFTITVDEPAKPPDSRPEVILDAREFRGYQVFHLNPDGEFMDDRSHSLLLGDDSAQVYVISTNMRHTTEVIRRDSRVTSRVTLLDPSPGWRPDAATRRGRDMALPDRGPLPDRSWVQEYNANPPRRRARADNSQRLSSVVGPRPVAEGDRETFLDLDYWNTMRVPATARRVVTDGAQTLAVWVADADWGVVRQEMVDALASRFLRPGPANDIYDWVTAALGPPWGPHDNPGMIPPQAAQQVHILLFDIDGDGRGGVAGFFFGKDLESKEYMEASNERVMFYLDSHWLAHQEGPTWEVTDPAPEHHVGAMAHELQHIIYFYHKWVLHGQRSTIWLNEMTSMVAEDLVSEKLPVHGPRGLPGDDPTATRNTGRGGQVLDYVFYNDFPVTTWHGGRESYAVNYALGAYLARTYGGAGLFRSIVQSELVGIDAIEEALRARGHDVSFADILVDWAVAGLLSDDTGARPPYRYNSGTWSTSSAGGLLFRLGSINLFIYSVCRSNSDGTNERCWAGPSTFSLEGFNESTARSPQPMHSNYLIDLGVNTGTVRMRISADSGNRFTVLVKDQ